MNRLLFIKKLVSAHLFRGFRINHPSVRRQTPARRIHRQSRGRSHRRRVCCLHVKFLAKRRNWRCSNTFRKPFLIDLRDIIDAQAAFACGHVRIFAAQLYLQNARIAFVLKRSMQLAIIAHKLPVIVRISNLLQRAANHRLRLSVFSGNDGFERISRSDVNVTAHEIDKVSSLQKQLRHPCVVVVVL